MIRRICVITGTRADYGLIYPVLKEIKREKCFDLQLVVTGSHLSPEFGMTYREIEKDGFAINNKVEMLLSSDTPVGTAKSMALGLIGFSDIFQQIKPDIILLLGDRYEIFVAAQAALVANIPIAHIAGGDITEGAFDEAIRHSLTKMSHLHFVTNGLSLKTVKQLGENPRHIFNVGSPGIDTIKGLKLLSRDELQTKLDFKFLNKNLLITFHPTTLDLKTPREQTLEVLKALRELGSETGLIFTMPNADPGGREIRHIVEEFASQNPNSRIFTSLGQLLYISLLAQVDAVVGNSSSGIYEAPFLKKPTVNIGDRQKGRLLADSIVNCEPIKDSVIKAIQVAYSKDCSRTFSPYGDGTSSKKIVDILKTIPNYRLLLKKRFFRSG